MDAPSPNVREFLEGTRDAAIPCEHRGCTAVFIPSGPDKCKALESARWRVLDGCYYCPLHRRFHRPIKPGKWVKELPNILQARAEGLSYRKIGERYGVSYQRIQRIVKQGKKT